MFLSLGCTLQACSEFTGHALKVLSRQNTIRPINQTEMDSQVARIEGEFSKVEHLLKKDTCASVMRLRNEFLDARLNSIYLILLPNDYFNTLSINAMKVLSIVKAKYCFFALFKDYRVLGRENETFRDKRQRS